MNKPLVSVILPIRNGAKFLKKTLESVFNQDYENIEVIVVDNDSTDNCQEIVKLFDVKYFHQENRGVGNSRNWGVKIASGDLIAFIDADDLWVVDKLSKQVKYLEENQKIAIVATNQRLTLESGQEVPAWVREGQLDSDLKGYLPSAIMVRRWVFESIGYFNPEFETSSDADWFFRLKDSGLKMSFMPEVLVQRRIHDTNQSNAVEQVQSELLKIVRMSVNRKSKELNNINSID